MAQVSPKSKALPIDLSLGQNQDKIRKDPNELWLKLLI